MQFQIKRDTLFKSLSIAHNIIERKSTIPILSNVLLETKNNKPVSYTHLTLPTKRIV